MKKLESQLTTISAITRGCLNGLNRTERPRVTTRTTQICKIARGSAKSRGLSPWKTPFDVAFIGCGHICPKVPLDAIVQNRETEHYLQMDTQNCLMN